MMVRLDDVEPVTAEQKGAVGGARTCTGGVLVALRAVSDTETANGSRFRVDAAEAEVGAEPDLPFVVLEHAVDGVVGQSAAEPVTLELRTAGIDVSQAADSGERSDPYPALPVDQQTRNCIAGQRMTVSRHFPERTNFAGSGIDCRYAIRRAGPDGPGVILGDREHIIAAKPVRNVEALHCAAIVVMDEPRIVRSNPEIAIAGAKYGAHRRSCRLAVESCVSDGAGLGVQAQKAVIGGKQQIAVPVPQDVVDPDVRRAGGVGRVR